MLNAVEEKILLDAKLENVTVVNSETNNYGWWAFHIASLHGKARNKWFDREIALTVEILRLREEVIALRRAANAKVQD